MILFQVNKKQICFYFTCFVWKFNKMAHTQKHMWPACLLTRDDIQLAFTHEQNSIVSATKSYWTAVKSLKGKIMLKLSLGLGV